jgi:hypothetical protein
LDPRDGGVWTPATRRLDADLVDAFADSKSVNDALRRIVTLEHVD